MFMTKMVSALPQPAATATASATARSGACSLQPAACCNLPPAMQIEKMPKSRCKWSCRCVSRAASAFACLPLLLCMPPSLLFVPLLSPSLSVQLGAVRQAASHQLNIVMRFTLTQPSLLPPPRTPSAPSRVANIQYVFQLAFHHLLSSSFKSLEL